MIHSRLVRITPHSETVLRCVKMCCSAAYGGGEAAARVPPSPLIARRADANRAPRSLLHEFGGIMNRKKHTGDRCHHPHRQPLSHRREIAARRAHVNPRPQRQLYPPRSPPQLSPLSSPLSSPPQLSRLSLAAKKLSNSCVCVHVRTQVRSPCPAQLATYLYI